jgi:hypothetical protein
LQLARSHDGHRARRVLHERLAGRAEEQVQAIAADLAAAHYDQLRPLAVLKQRHDRVTPPHDAGNLDVREFLLPAGHLLGQGPALVPPHLGRAESERMGPHPIVDEYLAPRVHRRHCRVSQRGLFARKCQSGIAAWRIVGADDHRPCRARRHLR